MYREKWYATVPLVVYFYHQMIHRTRQDKYEKKLQENEAELELTSLQVGLNRIRFVS